MSWTDDDWANAIDELEAENERLQAELDQARQWAAVWKAIAKRYYGQYSRDSLWRDEPTIEPELYTEETS
jgi:hypothetical protein